jgi:hypothetical protein
MKTKFLNILALFILLSISKIGISQGYNENFDGITLITETIPLGYAYNSTELTKTSPIQTQSIRSGVFSTL